MKHFGSNLGILMVSETKIDDTFLESEFLIEDFSTLNRLDWVLLYIRQDIPSKYFKKSQWTKHSTDFFVELNLRSRKWLLGCSYSPHKEKITSHLSNLSTALDKLWMDYENITLQGDFNVEVDEKNIPEFMSSLRNLIEQKTF